MHTPKTMAERFVAGHRLSARHPTVFGLSPWATKLASIQAGKISHEKKKVVWSCQIYQAMKALNASGSASPIGVEVFTGTSIRDALRPGC